MCGIVTINKKCNNFNANVLSMNAEFSSCHRLGNFHKIDKNTILWKGSSAARLRNFQNEIF